MQPVLSVQNLVKHFGEVKAVNDVSFEVHRGTCLGLLGPNGAGKTTTIEIMEGILEPTAGNVLYEGRPLDQQFHYEAGMQFQSTALPEFITVKEVLEMFHTFYPNAADINEVIKLCDLSEFLTRDNARLSGGQRQRLLLAVALINNPEILFLDEPTTGLDPQARRNLWNLVEMVKEKQKTLILTTHYMDEAYVLCDEIIIMDHGKIIAHGSPKQLLKQYFDEIFIQIPQKDFNLDEFDLSQNNPLGQVMKKNDVVEIITTEVNQSMAWLLEHNISLNHLQIRSANLEDLFLKLTGKTLRE